MPEFFINPYVNPEKIDFLSDKIDFFIGYPWKYHQFLPHYQKTPIISPENLKKMLNVKELWVKDESFRLGLPAFKILGASWAIYRQLQKLYQIDIRDFSNFEAFILKIHEIGNHTLVTATDGNHGRAIAHIAKWFNWNAFIFMPNDSAPARIEAIKNEGAEVIIVDGDYDLAVKKAAEKIKELGKSAWLIQDTAWDGYIQIPAWIQEGYQTLGHEIASYFEETNNSIPDVILVQIGVGSLAAAIIQYFKCTKENQKKRSNSAKIPVIIGLEPEGVGGALLSIKNDKITPIPGPYDSIMAGMNCGTISTLAWPLLKYGINGFLTVSNQAAVKAMQLLAHDKIESGETGAAGIGALIEIFSTKEGNTFWHALGLTKTSSILVISTEGITNPEFYQKIIS